MPTKCPVTGEALEVTRLQGPTSGVVIEGRFVPNEFALLPSDHTEFLRLFVKVRGNLKEAERIMGVSYPTVRLRFDNLLKALGYEVDEAPADARSDILARLERGEIDAKDAAKQLQDLKRR
ncbi:MAG: DUF2089 domain-containing protein [Trueperaceae bacterium]|nr:DUF2089 domain-containing protein [Trueperaceae bacterium]